MLMFAACRVWAAGADGRLQALRSSRADMVILEVWINLRPKIARCKERPPSELFRQVVLRDPAIDIVWVVGIVVGRQMLWWNESLTTSIV